MMNTDESLPKHSAYSCNFYNVTSSTNVSILMDKICGTGKVIIELTDLVAMR